MRRMLTLFLLIPVVQAEEPEKDGPVYACDFEKLADDKLPADFMVMSGTFAVVQEDDAKNRCLELPGTPLPDDLPGFGILFGPVEAHGFAIEARIHAQTRGRRPKPTFCIGTNGIDGYLLRVHPKEGKLELVRNDGEKTVLAGVDFEWKSGAWTRLRLQVRKSGEAAWALEGKAWEDGQAEPKDWTIRHALTDEPRNGRFSIWGSPYSQMAICFDDLTVTKAKD